MRRHLLAALRTRSILLPILVVAALGVFVIRAHLGQSQDPDYFFERALSDAGVRETVRIDETIYRIENGDVFIEGGAPRSANVLPALLLAYEKTTARRSPILALPGLDPDKIESAAKELATNADALSLYSKGEEATLVREHLYPIRFLLALAQTERARRAFIESGTRTDGLLYRSSVRTLLDSYERDLRAFRLAFETVVPPDIGSYATPRYLISREDSIDALDRLADGARRWRAAALKREACFAGVAQLCDTDDLLVPAVREVRESPRVSTSSAEMRSLLQGAGVPLSDSPLVEITSSACVEDRPNTAHIFAKERVPRIENSPAYDAPFFIGDILFMDTEKLRAFPFYAYFRDQGVRYVLTRPVAYYTCPHADVDMDAVVMTERVHEFSLRRAETIEPMGGKETYAESDARAYLSRARDLMVQGELPQTTADELSELLLELNSGSWGLYHTMLDIGAGERTEMLIDRRGIGIEFDPMIRFFVRSGYMSFLGFTMNIDERLSLFPQNHIPEKDRPFVYYTDMTLTQSALADLRDDISSYVQTHDIGTAASTP